MRGITRRLVAAAVAVAILVGAAPAAASASVVSSASGGANFRGLPWHPPFRWLPNGTVVDMICWQDSVWAQGNYWTNRWYYSTARVGGRYYNPSGWVHASLVAHPASVARCNGFPVGSGG